jgi:tricorn protease
MLLAFVAASAMLAPSPMASAQLQDPQEKPIRIGRTPALSPDGSQICFTYQGNLWVVPTDGGVATRLTANDSFDINAKWSPDGKWIAFNSDREGGNQVFVMPAIGGPAKQVTAHSSAGTVYDWFPDGKSLLFASTKDTRRVALYKLDVATGRMKKVVEDNQNCKFASVSPDGKYIAFTRGALADNIRKGYHGSANYDIYVVPADGSAPAKAITDSDKNDMWPVWSSDSKTVFYSSERAGLSTIWKNAREGGKQTQVVQSPPDAIRYVSSARNGQMLAYEADDQICVTPTSGGPAKIVKIICRTDEKGPKTTYQTFNSNSATEFELSPDGKRTALGIRGDIFEQREGRRGEASHRQPDAGSEHAVDARRKKPDLLFEPQRRLQALPDDPRHDGDRADHQGLGQRRQPARLAGRRLDRLHTIAPNLHSAGEAGRDGRSRGDSGSEARRSLLVA